MNTASRVVVVLTIAIVVLSGLPGVVGASEAVVPVGPPDEHSRASPTDVTGEIILGEDRDMAAAGGATGTITVIVEQPAAARGEGLSKGRVIVRDVGRK